MSRDDQRMPEIEYFYSAHSAYAYIGSRALAEICAKFGATLVHKPIRLREVVEACGAQPFPQRTKAHADYYFGRELERWSAFRGVPLINHRPTHHDNDLDLANGMLIAAAAQGADVDALAHAVLENHWRDDGDHANFDNLAAIARSCGVEPNPLLQAALTPEIQARHAANTAEAIERSVFGSPTYIVDGDPFYGQDRLEMMDYAMQGRLPPSPGFANP